MKVICQIHVLWIYSPICDLPLHFLKSIFGREDFLAFFFFFFLIFIYLFIYLWLCWVFVSVRGLSPVVASGGHSSSRCAGLSLSRPLLLRSTGSRRAGSVIVAHGLSCSAACGIFPAQGSNPCSLHWQADSQPLRHHGSPREDFLILIKSYLSIYFFVVDDFCTRRNCCLFYSEEDILLSFLPEAISF